MVPSSVIHGHEFVDTFWRILSNPFIIIIHWIYTFRNLHWIYTFRNLFFIFLSEIIPGNIHTLYARILYILSLEGITAEFYASIYLTLMYLTLTFL